MNVINNDHGSISESQSYTQSINDPELYQIMTKIQMVVDEVYSEKGDDDYIRDICIEIPNELSPVVNVSEVRIPIHDALNWSAASLPSMGKQLYAIRDEFYSASEDDYSGVAVEEAMCFMGHEECARLKYEWEYRRPKKLTYASDLQPEDPLLIEGTKGQYPRYIRVEIPSEAAILYGIEALELPISEILHWISASKPDHLKSIAEIRRALFPEPIGERLEPKVVIAGCDLATPERVEKIKRARLEKRESLVTERARIKSDLAKADFMEANSWELFAFERSPLEAEQEALDCRADEIERKWFDFVVESKRRGEGPDEGCAHQRRRLHEEGRALGADQDALAERWSSLSMRVTENARVANL